MRSGEKLIGSVVYVKPMYNEWGVVVDYDGDVYHIAMWNDRSSVPIFDRKDFTVPNLKNQMVLKKKFGIK